MIMFMIFAAVLVLLLLGVTTAVTMGFASIATFLFAGGDPARLFLVAQRMFSQVSGITLMSIPFFLLMGNLMSVGGISKSLFGFGRVCLGHRWGGLSNAAIVACIVMAAMSGSAAACAAGIGMIAIAEMTKSGYSRSFSCATIAAGGALGPIIPPSITPTALRASVLVEYSPRSQRIQADFFSSSRRIFCHITNHRFFI